MKLLIIYNPKSGKGKILKHINYIKNTLSQKYEVSAHELKEDELIKDYIGINNKRYYLRGMICTPKFNHFTALIIKYNLQKDCNYYYDGNSSYNDVRKIDNTDQILEKDLPYLALYSIS